MTFLQYRVPEFVEQFVDLCGAVVALAFFDRRISVTCLCVVIPLTFMSRLYARRVMQLQKEVHDHRESLFSIFQKESLDEIRDYYRTMAQLQMKIANWGALNFGIIRLFLLGIFLMVLFIAIDLDDFSPGQVYSVVAYPWTFVTSTEYLPDLMESYTSIKEIQHRVRSETPVEPEEVEYCSDGATTSQGCRGQSPRL